MRYKRILNEKLNEYLKKSYHLRILIDNFNLNNYTYGIVGGFVRDTILEKNSIKDVDIIVDVDFEELMYVLENYNIKYQHNTFKGLKIYDKTNNLYIDLWSLSDHRPFRQGYFKKSWKNIPKSSYINCGGCIWIPNKNKLYLGKTKKFIKNKLVDFYNEKFFNSHHIDNKHIIAVKLLNYYEDCEYKLSESCVDFLKTYLSKQKHITSIRRFARENNIKVNINKFIAEQINEKITV